VKKKIDKRTYNLSRWSQVVS